MEVIVAVATPVLAFLGVIVGIRWNRVSATELDVWRRREETMHMLRWAAERAVESDERTSLMGVAALDALRFSELLQPVDYDLVDGVTDAVMGSALDMLEQDPGADVVLGE